ncbi:unnamed protein product [Prunus armeniaca]|uniref:Uncharacterized protein n=1 Tax=Prunus armeniaca TaxID=36596 RepID=A0A6J5XKQ0_PRUAR|nr:unnamed protein product [Prunus armeniaca]
MGGGGGMNGQAAGGVWVWRRLWEEREGGGLGRQSKSQEEMFAFLRASWLREYEMVSYNAFWERELKDKVREEIEWEDGRLEWSLLLEEKVGRSTLRSKNCGEA